MNTRMKPEEARELNSRIRFTAESDGLDLNLPENKFTLWRQNGGQLILVGHSEHLDALHATLGEEVYTSGNPAVVFDRERDEVREFSWSIGRAGSG